MYTLKEFEDYLRRKNPGKYDKRVSNIYPAKASSMDKPSTAPETPTISDTVRPWDVENKENTFYANEGNSGIIRFNEQTRKRLSDAQKPFVPTMTEPIQRYSQPDEQGSNSDPYAIQENRQAQYTNPYDIPSGYNPNDYVYKSTQQAPTNDPYGKTWTPEEQKRKQLQDAMTQRDNLKNSFVGMPTTKVVLKLGEFDDTIQRLSQELGLGQKEYMPGVEGGWQEETKPAPYTAGVEGGDIGVDALQGVHFGGSVIERGVPDTGGAGGGGGGGGSWGDEEEDSGIFNDIVDTVEDVWNGFTGWGSGLFETDPDSVWSMGSELRKQVNDLESQLEDLQYADDEEGIREVQEAIREITTVDWDENGEAQYNPYIETRLWMFKSETEANIELGMVAQGDIVGFDVAANLLRQSLGGTGEPRVFEGDHIVASTLANDDYTRAQIENVLDAKTGEVSSDAIELYYQDQNRDLFFAFGHAWLNISDVQKQDGNWIVTVTLNDTYDFDEWALDGSMGHLGAYLNNVGLAGQYYGSVVPYDFTVNVTYEIPAE